MITFKEDTHQYFDKYNREYTSVSSTIHKYIPPFDPDGEITRKYANKNKKTIEQVKTEWSLKGQNSCILGTAIHKQCEDYILTKQITGNWSFHLHDYISNNRIGDKLIAEKIIYNTEKLICGTADLVVMHGNKKFSIDDYKSNEQIRKDNKYGVKMLAPFDHMDYCEFNTYSFQLSMYAYMTELFGFTLVDLAILHMDKKLNKINPIKVPYLKDEIKWIFNQKKI